MRRVSQCIWVSAKCYGQNVGSWQVSVFFCFCKCEQCSDLFVFLSAILFFCDYILNYGSKTVVKLWYFILQLPHRCKTFLTSSIWRIDKYLSTPKGIPYVCSGIMELLEILVFYSRTSRMNREVASLLNIAIVLNGKSMSRLIATNTIANETHKRCFKFSISRFNLEQNWQLHFIIALQTRNKLEPIIHRLLSRAHFALQFYCRLIE